MATDNRVTDHKKALLKNLSQLVGGTITAVDAVVEDDFGFPLVWPVLKVTFPNGTKLDVVISTDEEGNGAGHLFIGAEGTLYSEVEN
jgi:hypothetical protein